MLERYLAADAAPGMLTPFLPIEFQDLEYGGHWLWMATPLRDGLEDGCYEVAFRDGGVLCEANVPPERIRLDVRLPSVMARICAWAWTGERCEWDGLGSCPECGQEHGRVIPGRPDSVGWIRPPHDLTALLPVTLPGGKIATVEKSAALLIMSVKGIVSGRGPVKGILPPWHEHDDGTWYRDANAYEYACAVFADVPGWRFALGERDVRGPETGDAGKACADRAAMDAGFALDGPDMQIPDLSRPTEKN